MAGIILAGGQSRRMGEDKALLPWRGGTLLEHVAATLSSVTYPVVVVSDEPERYRVFGASAVRDLYPGMGPLGGIISGLDVCPEWGYHAVVGCDMPLIEAGLLKFLFELGEQGNSVDAVVPVVGGDLQPLCAVYSRGSTNGLRYAFESGERSVVKALDYLRVLRVEESKLREFDPTLRSFTNMNTREEYEQFWRQYGQA